MIEFFIVAAPGDHADESRVIISSSPLAGDKKLAGPFGTYGEARSAIPEVVIAWQVLEA